jgi:protein O-mannosyl-transferase
MPVNQPPERQPELPGATPRSDQESRPDDRAAPEGESTAPSARASRRRPWLFAVLLVLVTALAYRPAWNGGYVWDDDCYVSHNLLLSAPDGLRRIWFSLESPSQYFPLTYTTFRLEHSFWGFNPSGYHWVNILMHAANALLLWGLLRRLEVPGARLAAMVFALHPVQVESVAWITELKNVQALFFSLLAVLAWVAFCDERPRRLWRYYALALLLYVLALTSKSTACTLPAALLLVLWLRRRPITWGRIAQVVPFILLGLAMGLLAMWWERYHQLTEGQVFGLGLLDRILIASRACWFYLGKLIWPAKLAFSYPLWKINPTDPLAYVWLAAGAGLAGLIYFARARLGRGVETAALFYVATLSPLLGFIMLYTFHITFVADHYQYMASIGPLALAAAGLTRGLESVDRKGVFKPMLCTAWVLTLGVLTWQQSSAYTDIETLWRRTIATNPKAFMAHGNLGAMLLDTSRTNEALAHLHKAIEIKPDYAEAHFNLGIAYSRMQRVDEAMVHFQDALRVRPDSAAARMNLGALLIQKGDLDGAISYLRRALEIRPGYAQASFNLANALWQKGQTEEAIVCYRAALKGNPDYAEADYNLGLVLFRQGELDQALPHFQKLIEINPGYASACLSFANELLKLGRVDQAATLLGQIVQLRPDYAEAHYNLGVALFQLGQADAAVAQFRRSLELRPNLLPAHRSLGNLLWRSGQIQEAIAHYEIIVSAQAADATLLNDLAWIRATNPQAQFRDGTEAMRLAEQACQATQFKEPRLVMTLAAAYAEAGRFEDAVTTAERARNLALAVGQKELAEKYLEILGLFKAGQAYREG